MANNWTTLCSARLERRENLRQGLCETLSLTLGCFTLGHRATGRRTAGPCFVHTATCDRAFDTREGNMGLWVQRPVKALHSPGINKFGHDGIERMGGEPTTWAVVIQSRRPLNEHHRDHYFGWWRLERGENPRRADETIVCNARHNPCSFEHSIDR